MSDDVFAADGRIIGSRALATRRKILDATAKLLEDRGILDMRVVDITREIDTSPATFYQYFADVDAAILELAKEATEDERPLVEHLQPSWNPDTDFNRAIAFIDAYMKYWHEHAAVLRMRNLKAEEGVKAFREERSQANMFIIKAMQQMIAEGIKAGRLPETLDAFTVAAALLAMIERLLGYEPEMAKRGSSVDKIRETLASICFVTLARGV